MDGEGSIQVNHWRSRVLQFRLVIKLKYSEANFSMLKTIARAVGGGVRLEKGGLFVVWVANDRSEVEKILKIYEKYPPLTTRV